MNCKSRVLYTLAGMLAAAGATDAATADAGAGLCGSGPLEILLTNDDGFEAPGIRALYGQLRAAGHRVLLVAPATNASGSSSSFTWGKVAVTRSAEDANIYAIAGTPATAVVLGATALYPADRRPDLVISGINDGTNTGSLLALSGTVGAALAGTMLLEPPVPGVAVNAERPQSPESKQSLPAAHLEQVAAHLARLIESARGWYCDHGRLVRPKTVLNINYPSRPVASVRGVKVATQGRTTDLHLDFEPAGDGMYESRRVESPAQSDDAGSDNALLEKGYVTVTPISADLDQRAVPSRELQRLLGK
jgi:5'/3'-nucleotidase SurE